MRTDANFNVGTRRRRDTARGRVRGYADEAVFGGKAGLVTVSIKKRRIDEQ